MTEAEWRRFRDVGGFKQFELPRKGIMTWKIWGDSKDPLFEGTEDEVKTAYKASYAKRDDTYVEDPDGNEFVYSTATKEFRQISP
jgi:hypothetical protein